jgi:hypothetical protein
MKQWIEPLLWTIFSVLAIIGSLYIAHADKQGKLQNEKFDTPGSFKHYSE